MPGLNNKINILVVDDEPFVLNLAVQILNKLGFMNIQTASDGSFALGVIAASEEPVDLILCDLNMPEVDGLEFMRLAIENGYEGALIFLSGEDRRILETAIGLAKVHKINVLGAIQKPLKPDILKDMLASMQPTGGHRDFTPQESITRKDLEAGIQNIDQQGLSLVYQPKVEIESGSIVSVEALARWNHKEKGLLGPAAFIPLAEKEGLINSLTMTIYREAVRQVREWRDNGIEITVSVNFSINTFLLDKLSDYLLESAREFDVNPDQIVLEITETQVMENAINCLEVLMRLRLKKFSLSIDDFGTGNSSLAQLKSIPFNELKIDRAFVSGANQNSSAMAILETSVALAKKLDMSIVAEGVETYEDWDICETLGVDHAQGFYCADPMPAAEFTSFMANWKGPHRKGRH